jgi:hypothetical protein
VYLSQVFIWGSIGFELGGREGRQGGSIGFEFVRVDEGLGEREDKGGVQVEPSCEVTNKRNKIRSLLFRQKKIFFMYLSSDCMGKIKT